MTVWSSPNQGALAIRDLFVYKTNDASGQHPLGGRQMQPAHPVYELDIWLIDSEILIWRFAGATDLTSADR